MKKLLASLLACALLLAGCANNKESMPTVGIAQIVSHPSLNTIRDAMVKELKKKGYEDGKNIKLVYGDASGQVSNLNTIMNQFEQEDAKVIVAIATPTAQSAAKLSKKIPVVFSAVSDPVGAKLVKSLDKPGNNITGTSDEVQMDQILDLALKMTPDIKTIGYLYNASEANSVANLEKAKAYAKKKGLTIVEATGKDITELQTSASVLVNKVDAVLSPNDNTVASGMNALSKICLEAGKPFYVGADSMVKDGGLATVGIDYENLGKATADMVIEVLKGKSPKDMPVKVFKTDLNTYVNQKVLETLGLSMPDGKVVTF